MGARLRPTPQQAPARAPTVAGFYGMLALAAFFWHAVAQDTNDIWQVGREQGWFTLLLTPLWGLALGLLTVRLFRSLEPRMLWLRELRREFHGLFGGSTDAEVVMLAAASALGEELLFRGAMLDAWGVWGSSLCFALLHIPKRRALWPWTLSSLVLGLALAGLTVLTGNLGAAVLAHFVINLLNLAHITRRPTSDS